jgi:hypothetical protein
VDDAGALSRDPWRRAAASGYDIEQKRNNSTQVCFFA